MTITATEFKTNFGKYLKESFNEDIFITKNGRIIAQVSKPQKDKIEILSSLVGCLKTNKKIDEKNIKSKRLSRQ